METIFSQKDPKLYPVIANVAHSQMSLIVHILHIYIDNYVYFGMERAENS